MNKFLLSLIVLATLTSCGKDNKVSSGSTAVTNGYSNPYLSGGASAAAQDLIAKINNPSSFGQGLVLISSGSSSQNCGTKWGFINYCYGSSGSGNYASSSGMTWNQVAAQSANFTYYYHIAAPVAHASVDVATKQTQLTQLINSATAIQYSGPLYYIQVSNTIYVVDIRYPIQANPSALKTVQYEDYLKGGY